MRKKVIALFSDEFNEKLLKETNMMFFEQTKNISYYIIGFGTHILTPGMSVDLDYEILRN